MSSYPLGMSWNIYMYFTIYIFDMVKLETCF
jgi:hypothetical protein